jgi:RNA polymerase sigma factor (sigma-70 family)
MLSMAASPLTRFLDLLRTRMAVAEFAGASDKQLLQCFIRQRNDAAFEVLVRRHGAMVWTVCRGVLKSEHDVEDAVQATFLVLARKASSIRRHTSLGSWLHGVAYRIALKARASRQRQTSRCLPDLPGFHDDIVAVAATREEQTILHEELQNLPDRLRSPLVMCYLEGRTNSEAARLLGLKVGTVDSRLARGRQRLRVRLSRRGLVVAAGSIGLPVLEKPAAAAAIAGAVSLARLVAAGETAVEGGISFSALGLAEGFIHTAMLAKVKTAAAIAALICTLAVGAGWAGQQMLTGQSAQSEEREAAPKAQVSAVAERPTLIQKPHTDFYGDPLPPGVLARLGTTLFQHKAGHLVFSADSKKMLSGSTDGLVQEWDVATSKLEKRIQMTLPQKRKENFKLVEPLLSPDGKLLTITDQKSVSLCDVASGKVLHTIGVSAPILAHRHAFSPDGKVLAIIDWDKDNHAVFVWDAKTGLKVGEFKHGKFLLDLSFSHDGKLLATADMEELHVWDTATGRERVKTRLDQSGGRLDRLCFAPDGKLIATVNKTTVSLWDTDSLDQQASFKSSRSMGFTTPFCLAFSPDAKLLATGGNDELLIWDVAERKEKCRYSDWHVNGLAFSADGKILACSGDSKIHLWDVAAERPLHDRQGHDVETHRLVQCNYGQLFASAGSSDRNVLLWDAGTGKPLGVLVGHNYWVTDCCFSTDGRWLASSAIDGTVRLWDTATRKELRSFVVEKPKGELRNKDGYVFHCGLSRDGKLLAAASLHYGTPNRTQVSVWEVATGKLLARRPLSVGFNAWFAPGVKAMLTKTAGGLILEDTATGQTMAPALPGETGSPVRFSPDGRLVALGIHEAADKKGYQFGGLSVIEIASAKEVLRLNAKQRWVDFSADGLALVTTDDEEIHVWDVATGQELLRKPGLEKRVPINSPIAFVHNSQALATGLRDGTILVWDLSPRLWPRPPKIAPPSSKELDALWLQLASEDAAKAHLAIYQLANAPAQVVPMLNDRLRPVPVADADLVQKFVADLNSEKFDVRQKATRQLSAFGEQIEPNLRKALAETPPLEIRQRLEKLISEFRTAPTPELLQRLRAVRVLEYIGTPAARQVIELLAGGAPLGRETVEAKEALERLGG